MGKLMTLPQYLALQSAFVGRNVSDTLAQEIRQAGLQEPAGRREGPAACAQPCAPT